MNNFIKGAIYAVLSSIGYGIMPIFTVKAYEYGVTVYTLLFLRFGLSSIIFFLFFLVKGTNIRIGKHEVKNLFILGGILFTLLSIFHFESLKYISSSMAVLLLYCFPLLVCIISYFLYKEKLSIGSILALVATFISMIYLLGVSLDKMNVYGIVLSLLAALIFAIYMIVGKRVTINNSPVIISAYTALFATFGVFIIGVVKQDISLNFNNQAWIHIVSIVIFSTIFAEITFFKSLELLSSSNVSMISMVEPVFTTLFALVFLNERLQFSQLTGGMFVLISLVVLVYSQNKSIKKPAINRTLIQNEHI
ncbi:DMT family transporter [Lysinibacillus sphaericus]|uniref:DMT family transporter n=1 Tax=Lysinibacillus tabacifolii TaxID=1173107 RepID=A0ABY2SXZ7_9BACI|nr:MULTISPECIES: DMT family transporter [Lysinibacillus]TKI48159.1 DMT family transporter [Lysinibacillus tabacifolii]UDK96043.1 DMT family transporter [Lysinibacillus sphaericus]